jgi:hypothetical protein
MLSTYSFADCYYFYVLSCPKGRRMIFGQPNGPSHKGFYRQLLAYERTHGPEMIEKKSQKKCVTV